MQFTSLSKNTPSPANDNPVVATAGMSNERAYQLLQALLQQLNQIILGKAEAVSDAVVCLLANGHLLIEDVPGVGKTTLAHTLAQSMGLQFARVQFTSDLMPSDLTGVSIYERNQEQFVFHPGPVFSQVLLADEINRASPKAQSALLEVMEERQVSAEGKTYALPQPFFVIATQNPLEQRGTQPLPESQLDRFLMRLSLGYPDRAAEYGLLAGTARRDLLQNLQPVMQATDLLQLQALVQNIHASDALIHYLQDLLTATRNGQWFEQGLSPRAGVGILRAAKAHALLAQRQDRLCRAPRRAAADLVGHQLPDRPPARRRGMRQGRV